MVKCCVEGCQDRLDEAVFFELPTSRSLRRKWLDVLNIGNKVPVGTVVCKQHFHRKEYEIVRGKVRLKRKVVPTLMLQKKSPKLKRTKKTCQHTTVKAVLRDKKLVANSDPPQPDSTTGNIVEAEDIPSGETLNSVERDCPQRVPQQPPDFEEMITNYQIKNSKPHSLLPPAREAEAAILVDGKGDAPPVFIEIPVDKDNSATNAGNEDCLMVLESVQVDVDPTSLMLPDRGFDDEPERDFGQDVERPDKKDDPISLLTSSDEDDVIIQEPHIDTVEVSDETDEDDVPLVKLVNKQKAKKKSKKKKPSTEALNSVDWNGAYDFYCMQCHFTTTDNLEYNNHIQEHEKVLQVCSVCSYTTPSTSQFKRHLRKHREEKIYKCHLCAYRAKHNMSLIYHVQSHEADKHYVQNVRKGFKCMKCGCFHSAVKSAVLKHVRTCGSNDKLFSCEECDYVTKRKSDLKRHWMRRHEDKIVDLDSEGSPNLDRD